VQLQVSAEPVHQIRRWGRYPSHSAGSTEAPLTTKSPEVIQAMMERVDSMVPMQRMGAPNEIADGAIYLAGGRGSFVTGTALFVDGYTPR
jgi:NAD(P)-dependent dehydrogenase (short-subunit alcohol dehydrogenase family)